MKSLNDAINEVHKNIANSATANLKHIYENSEWYSARYIAGQAIGMDKDLISRLPDWASSLKESCRATKTEYRSEPYEVLVNVTPQDGMAWKYEDVYAYETRYSDVPCEVPDEQKRQNATEDAIKLYKVAKKQLLDGIDDPRIKAFLTEIYHQGVGRIDLTTVGVQVDQLGDYIKLSAAGQTELTMIDMEIGKTLGFLPLTVHLKIRILPALKARILPVLKIRVLPIIRWAVLLAIVGLIGYGLYSLWR